jgi:hypothetical protein
MTFVGVRSPVFIRNWFPLAGSCWTVIVFCRFLDCYCYLVCERWEKRKREVKWMSAVLFLAPTCGSSFYIHSSLVRNSPKSAVEFPFCNSRSCAEIGSRLLSFDMTSVREDCLLTLRIFWINRWDFLSLLEFSGPRLKSDPESTVVECRFPITLGLNNTINFYQTYTTPNKIWRNSKKLFQKYLSHGKELKVFWWL